MVVKLAIVAGGPETLIPDLLDPKYENFQWIGADRGTFVLLSKNIKPIKAFGDFDSVSKVEYHVIAEQAVDCETFPCEKDKTDLELAIDWALAKKPQQLLIFGVTGGRQDHALSAVYLLLKASRKATRMQLVDKKNSIELLDSGIYHLEKEPNYPYLSFLAISGKVTGLTLRGVKYPLHDAELVLGSSLCISNEQASDVSSVSFASGLLLMMRCSD